MDWTPRFKIGDVVSNKELYEEFLCGNMGGMRRSKSRNCLVIICDHTKMYDDKWKDGVLHYTGMGKNGDQTLDGNQNKTLYESNSNGVAVYLFEVLEATKYTYRGQVIVAGTPYKETQAGENGQNRQVWMFPLKPLATPFEGDNPFKAPETIPPQEIEEEQARVMPLEELGRLAAQRSTRDVEQREVTSRQYSRNTYISELAKRLANGKCELCRQPAPFLDRNGKPYLETHHVLWLSQGGADSIDNTVALCPNCHRKMHIVADSMDITKLLGIAKSNAMSIED